MAPERRPNEKLEINMSNPRPNNAHITLIARISWRGFSSIISPSIN